MTSHPNRSRNQAMEFLTLNSGGTVMSPRSHAQDSTLQRIRAALSGDGVLWAGWSVAVHDVSRGLFRFSLLMRGVAFSDCWLCTSAAASPAAWESAESAAPPLVVLHRPRGVPWLAVSLRQDTLLAAARDPQRRREIEAAVLELADAQQCVAWALLGMPPGAVRMADPGEAHQP